MSACWTRTGGILTKARVEDDLAGVARLHQMAADHAEEPSEVVVGIETDRGLLVGSLVATGYRVYAINPMAASRYRDRHAVSRAKSDPGDAKVLADLVRTDRHNHREVAGDSELAEAVKVLSRAHQNLVWSRQHQQNRLRSALREFYPGALQTFGTELASADALAVLGIAPTPERGRRLTYAKIRRALQARGRQRRLEERTREIYDGLREPQLEAPAMISDAYGETVRSKVAILFGMNEQVGRIQAELSERFERHPDAEILRSLPRTRLGPRRPGARGVRR